MISLDIKTRPNRRAIFISVVALCTIIFCSPADASMMVPGRNWSIAGPGGYYGFVETESVTLHSDHVDWETAIACGPLHLTLPCQAPAAVVCAGVVSVIVGFSVFIIISRLRNRVLKHTNAA
jgi:hypothetical protein